MTQSRRVLGETGEELAARYLEAQGLRLLERNVRLRGGELDIVARDGPVLVFVEVRTRRGTRFGTPEESVDRRKQERLARLAREYLQDRRLSGVNCRFDVVSVLYLRGEPAPRILHIRDAFSA